MRISNFIIIIIWLAFLSQAILQGLDIPNPIVIDGKELGLVFPLALFPLPFLFFLLAAFFQRKSKFDIKFLRNYIDKRYGSGVYANFVSRLKPSILFMSCLLVLGITGIIATFVSTKTPTAYYNAGFFLSGGLGLLGAYMLSIKYPPRLE